MRRLVFSLCMVLTHLATLQSLSAAQFVEVEDLPQFSLQPAFPNEVIQTGDSLEIALSFKNVVSDAEIELIDHRVFSINVEADKPIEIAVEADAGLPVIMISDGPFHPLDIGIGGGVPEPGSTTQSSSQNDDDFLFGNPIAYSVGTTRSSRLALTPDVDGIWQIWVWVLKDALEEHEPIELSDDVKSVYLEQGYSEDQIQLIFQSPMILRAWDAY